VRADGFPRRLNVASDRPNDTTRMWWLAAANPRMVKRGGVLTHPEKRASRVGSTMASEFRHIAIRKASTRMYKRPGQTEKTRPTKNTQRVINASISACMR
jgi:hypothetical protein